ncbi:MAG: hypothetical protein M0Q95_12750 [Porticoccaceae bacterium]|nr:hypothetical protein [Porticoccaceae bacterium]
MVATFLMTLALAFVVVLVALLLFWKFGAPFYRVEKENIVKLLELILSGQATEADWEVFAGYPIRHDAELEKIQQRCLDIAESHYTGGRRVLFTEEGLALLQKVLDDLRDDFNHDSTDNQRR